MTGLTGTDLPRGRVLVVDDVESNRELLRQELEDEGFEVAVAVSGPEAIEMARSWLPAVIILDIRMPGMDGIETCRRLKRDPATTHVPVLFLTGNSDDSETVVEALTAGGNDFLQKPCVHPILVARVGSQVAIFQAQAQLLRMAMTDELTGLYSRRFLFDNLRQHLQRLSRGNPSNMGCLLIDIDRFKDVNDRYGHLEGDRMLQELSTLVCQCTRGSDTVARYGGEEIVVLLPATDAKGASLVAEKIRATIERKTRETGHAMTVSVGVSWIDDITTQLPDAPSRQGGDAGWEPIVDRLLSAADRALYRAKESGRNRVCTERCGSTPGDTTAKPSGGQDRRQHRRLGVSMTVDVRWQGEEIRRHAADVSVGGLALDGTFEVAQGTEVELTLHLDEGRAVEAVGTVVWRGPVAGLGMRCGVAFQTFAGDGQELLARFLAEMAR